VPADTITERRITSCLASLFSNIATDMMRGYESSSVYTRHDDYAQEKSVADITQLLAPHGRERASWLARDASLVPCRLI
jgi:hypothetical protein